VSFQAAVLEKHQDLIASAFLSVINLKKSISPICAAYFYNK
jgi:hypothetical protein